MAGKGKFALGALIGGAIGAVVGILAAPKSGKETREDIKTKAEDIKKEALVKADEIGQEVSKQAKRAQDKATELADEAKASVADIKDKTGRVAGEAAENFDTYRSKSENAVKGAIDGAKKGFNKKV